MNLLANSNKLLFSIENTINFLWFVAQGVSSKESPEGQRCLFKGSLCAPGYHELGICHASPTFKSKCVHSLCLGQSAREGSVVSLIASNV